MDLPLQLGAHGGRITAFPGWTLFTLMTLCVFVSGGARAELPPADLIPQPRVPSLLAISGDETTAAGAELDEIELARGPGAVVVPGARTVPTHRARQGMPFPGGWTPGARISQTPAPDLGPGDANWWHWNYRSHSVVDPHPDYWIGVRFEGNGRQTFLAIPLHDPSGAEHYTRVLPSGVQHPEFAKIFPELVGPMGPYRKAVKGAVGPALSWLADPLAVELPSGGVWSQPSPANPSEYLAPGERVVELPNGIRTIEDEDGNPILIVLPSEGPDEAALRMTAEGGKPSTATSGDSRGDGSLPREEDYFLRSEADGERFVDGHGNEWEVGPNDQLRLVPAATTAPGPVSPVHLLRGPHRLWVHGQEVTLTPAAFELMEWILQADGDWVKHWDRRLGRQINERVWDALGGRLRGTDSAPQANDEFLLSRPKFGRRVNWPALSAAFERRAEFGPPGGTEKPLVIDPNRQHAFLYGKQLPVTPAMFDFIEEVAGRPPAVPSHTALPRQINKIVQETHPDFRGQFLKPIHPGHWMIDWDAVASATTAPLVPTETSFAKLFGTEGIRNPLDLDFTPKRLHGRVGVEGMGSADARKLLGMISAHQAALVENGIEGFDLSTGGAVFSVDVHLIAATLRDPVLTEVLGQLDLGRPKRPKRL